MDFSALSSFIEEDNGSEGYEDLLGFSEGGPVGEDMEDDEQPSVQYFAEGGEVEEASAILQRMPKPGRAAQMLQSFAEGGEVEKKDFPSLLDISKQVNAAGAPVENVYSPTTAPAATTAASQINIPTFQPAAPIPTGSNIITPTAAPIAGLGVAPALTQPTTAPTTTARSLFEQINPVTMATTPTYTLPSYTPTVQTFNRPTLLTQEELQKAQPPLVRYEPSATYGGLQTYQGPLQTSPYADIPGAPTGGTVAPPPPAPPPNVTPGGYTYATYTTLTPDQLAGVGSKAQVAEAYKGIVTRQQADATAVRNEYNKALAEGNMAMVEQLKPLLVEQDAEATRAVADQAFVNKYFTGAGGVFETPEQYRQRMQEAQFKAQTITGLTGATDIAGLSVPVGTKADPYTAAVTQQTKEYNAALATYNQLKAAYGETDFVKNYFNEIVTPQKADVDALTAGTQGAALKAGATAAFNAITAGQGYKVAAPVVPEFRTEQATITAFAPAIKAYETNIATLTKARDAATNTGLTGYASRLDELLRSETDNYTLTLGQRQSAIDAAQPDPMRDYILGKQMVAQKIDAFAPIDLGNVDFNKAAGAGFDPLITRQKADMTAATNTYNQLVTTFGNKSDVAVNFKRDVLDPETADFNRATAMKTAASTVLGAINTARAQKEVAIPALAVTKASTDAAINKYYDDFIAKNYTPRITALNTAMGTGNKVGLDQYDQTIAELIGVQQGYIDAVNAAREDAFARRSVATRAMGSPPEGEVADSRSRALLKKLSGGSEANTVPLQKFSKGGAVKKAAQLLKSLGVTEDKVAGKELTTLQDVHTSLGDRIREGAAKMQQQMDAMEFKYGPGQYVFTESGAKKNLPPLQIKAKQLYGNQPVRETPISKASRDPVTGEVLRTPYEPGYLVRQQRPDGWAEFVIPESAIKGTVDGFARGGPVNRAQGSPIYGEIPDSGPITADTRAAFKAKGPSAASVVSDSAKLLRNITGQGLSNLESAVRGSIAAIPGSVGDIESIFRESDKTRRFATTEEVLRDYMPKRATKPTKEAKGFEEVGSYLPLPVPAGTVSKAAGATKRGAKKALEELGPTTERILEKAIPKMGVVPEGPFIVLPSKLAEIEKSVLEKRGKSESKRVQKAADEVKNLEDQYTEEALREVFSGDNTNLLMVGNPAEFKEFAAKLEEPYRPAVERYWREMSARGGGAPSIPFLYINKEKSTLPFISGHEGRHRNIAMQELGYPSTLWRLMPRSALREDLPRRTREEYIKALLEQIGEKPLVIPEARWTPETEDKDFVNQRVLDWKKARNLPKPFVRGGEVKNPASTNEPTTPGMFSQASKLFKDLTSRAPADTTLNMSQYEQMYALKDVGSPEKGRKAALNVYSSLLPALMRARFPDYVANSPARVLKDAPRGAENVGEFDVFYRTIALDPEGANSMLMEPYGKYGYVGMGTNTTTDETLNALGTLLHESMHARTRGAEGKKRSVPHPAEQLKKTMPKDRFDEMIADIRISELPSVYSARSPTEVINEYFATATPVKQMVDKDMVTKRSRRYLAEVDRLAKKYPELEKMRVTWERPELFFKD